MSRTKHGSKPLGYDLTGCKVPGAQSYMHHSHRGHNWAKRAIHEAARRANRPSPEELAQVMYDRYADPRLDAAERALSTS